MNGVGVESPGARDGMGRDGGARTARLRVAVRREPAASLPGMDMPSQRRFTQSGGVSRRTPRAARQ